MIQMDRRTRRLLIRAIGGSSEAYRRLGLLFLTGRAGCRDRALARLCLKKSMEMGNVKGYVAYHRAFSKGKKIIDDRSYGDMCREYGRLRPGRRRRELKLYLGLGTKAQRARFGF